LLVSVLCLLLSVLGIPHPASPSDGDGEEDGASLLVSVLCPLLSVLGIPHPASPSDGDGEEDAPSPIKRPLEAVPTV